MKQILTLVFAVLLTSTVISQQKKVLFLGNSYTAVNNLPALVQGLAESAGYDIYVDKNTPGGYTLAFPTNGHLYNQTSLDKISAEAWDYVVLQEQSQYPVIEYYRNNYTFLGARELDSIIKQNNSCTQTMFYMTWGRKYGGQQCINGYCSVDFTDYAHMQDSLASAYLWMSNDLQTPVAPVGMAWKKSIIEYGDPIELFATDASHPSLAGSYLAACVYYAAIYHDSPEGLNYYAGLEEEDATYLQMIAAETVLIHLSTWNIDTTTVRAAFSFTQNSGTVNFNNLSLNTNTYFWDFGNGDSDTTFSPVYEYTQAGAYEVMLHASSDCKTDSVLSTIQIVISEINELINNTNKIIFYPSPGKDTFYFTTKLLSGSAIILVHNNNGKLVYQEERYIVTGSTESIEILHLKSGIYYCSIQNTDNKVSGQFVVIE
ncbi:MAG: PKD domain-containing protein [Bacteroidota bacterium]